MYVVQRGNKYRMSEKYRTPDGIQHVASITMDRNTPQSRTQAQKQLFEIIARKSTPETDLRLSELLNAYIADQKMTVKMSTWKRNESSLKRLVKILGDVQIQKLTAGYIRNKLLNYTDNPTTFNNYVRHLKAMLNWGFASDYLQDRTCIDKLHKQKDVSARKKIQDKYLEKSELEAVLNELSPFYALVAKFQVLSGLRIGETIALNDNDIDTEIHVTKTFDARNKIITTPKTEDSNRSVFIQPELATVIEEIRKTSNENRKKTGSKSRRFIIGTFGDPLSYDKFNRVFGIATEKAIGRKLSTHALRHTHVSFLAESVPLEVITRRIGHSDSKITKDIYLHITEDMKNRAADLITNVTIF